MDDKQHRELLKRLDRIVDLLERQERQHKTGRERLAGVEDVIQLQRPPTGAGFATPETQLARGLDGYG